MAFAHEIGFSMPTSFSNTLLSRYMALMEVVVEKGLLIAAAPLQPNSWKILCQQATGQAQRTHFLLQMFPSVLRCSFFHQPADQGRKGHSKPCS